MEIILATQNQGKLAEFNQLAKNTNISFISPPEGSIFPQETGSTFLANALIKAKFIFSLKRPHMFLNNVNEQLNMVVSTALTQK